MDEQQPEEKPAKTKKYGGRSKKFWFLVYLVIAVIVYFIIYWIWIRKPGGNAGGGLY